MSLADEKICAECKNKRCQQKAIVFCECELCKTHWLSNCDGCKKIWEMMLDAKTKEVDELKKELQKLKEKYLLIPSYKLVHSTDVVEDLKKLLGEK